MATTVTQQRRFAAQDPRQGHLEARQLEFRFAELLRLYPDMLAHARANTTHILKGVRFPLETLHEKVTDAYVRATSLDARAQAQIPSLSAARRFMRNPLDYPETQPTGTPADQLELPL